MRLDRVLPFALLLAACASSDIGRDRPATPRSDPTAEILELEKLYWEIMKTEDREAYAELIDDGFLGWPDGNPAPIKKPKMVQGAYSYFDEYEMVELDYGPVAVSMLGSADYANTYCQFRFLSSSQSGGESLVLSGYLTRTWIKRGGTWTLIGYFSESPQLSRKGPS